MPELRWNPVLEEWVITASARQDRPIIGKRSSCPFCPGAPEIKKDYDLLVLKNKFPSFSDMPSRPAVKGSGMYKTASASGICEVVLYSSDHGSTLSKQSVAHIERLVSLGKERTVALEKNRKIKYVFIFENKGEVIGVSLSHPHGQIYGFPFIPPRIGKELESARRFHGKNHKCLFCEILKTEMKDGRRLVYKNGSFAAFIPFYARWPYEVHIYPKAHIQSLADFSKTQEKDLAKALKTVLAAYDRLFGFSLPYMMVVHQRPSGSRFGYYHFHIEFYPPHRASDKLKYLGGVESGSGTFINDSHAEQTAAELRRAKKEDF